MSLQGVSLPGYRVCEYMIILNPHEELANKIASIRKDFNQEFKMNGASVSKANLMLASFTQYELAEERICNRLKTIALGFPPFKIELKDFGSFPSHTIFINVTSKLPIQKLVKTVRTETARMMKLNEENKPYFSLEPHINIARKLKPWQYEAAWLKYSHKNFTGRFIADNMLLLKRQPGNMNWQIVKGFELMNMPVVTKQGNLLF